MNNPIPTNTFILPLDLIEQLEKMVGEMERKKKAQQAEKQKQDIEAETQHPPSNPCPRRL